MKTLLQSLNENNSKQVITAKEIGVAFYNKSKRTELNKAFLNEPSSLKTYTVDMQFYLDRFEILPVGTILDVVKSNNESVTFKYQGNNFTLSKYSGAFKDVKPELSALEQEVKRINKK